MESNPGARLSNEKTLLREGIGLMLPALLAGLLFLLVPREGGSQGERSSPKAKVMEAKLCGEWHRGGGDTENIDLGAIKRAYSDLARTVAQSLDRKLPPASIDLDRPWSAGLPACRGEATRTEPIDAGKGGRFAKRTLYFVSAQDPSRVLLPPEVAKDPDAQILVVLARSFKDLPKIAENLGRPVSLGSAPFARALGVRCANTWLKISEKGDEVELHESR